MTMRVSYAKYHALENDFLVIESARRGLTGNNRARFARAICHRRKGVGADGVLFLETSKKADARIDIYNADGSWAEKSGNGLRIAALHLRKQSPRRKQFCFQNATSIDKVLVGRKSAKGQMLTAELGRPDFSPDSLPVKTNRAALLNSPLKIGSVRIPVTCLSVGNPHTVMVVDNFDFDWKQLGHDLEHSPLFPRGTNVEFVLVKSKRKLIVADWERGAGATGSSGTGAAASVCAMVMLGLAERKCKVIFEAGTIEVHWRSTDDIVEVTGPVQAVSEGQFEFS